MIDAINKWQQHGAVYFWRYKPEKGNLRGWHFAADKPGCESTIELLDLLKDAEYPAKRTMKLVQAPTSITNRPFAHVGRKIVSPSALRIIADPADPKDYWRLNEDGDRAEMKLGREGLGEGADAVRSVKNGEYDFSVGPWEGNIRQNIWFW